VDALQAQGSRERSVRARRGAELQVQRVHEMPAREMEEQLRPVPQGGFLQARDPDHQVRAVCRRVRVRARTGEGGVQAVHRSRDLPARNVEGEVQDVQRVAEEPVPPRPSELLLQGLRRGGHRRQGDMRAQQGRAKVQGLQGMGAMPAREGEDQELRAMRRGGARALHEEENESRLHSLQEPLALAPMNPSSTSSIRFTYVASCTWLPS